MDERSKIMTLAQFLEEWHSPSDHVLVHTSGSTGKPKPLWVEKRRMEASARMTCDFLGLCEGDTALLCMPLDYIAGKMMVVRSLVGGLRLINVTPSGHPLSSSLGPVTFAAMVPLQVWNSLQVSEEREQLMRIRHLIIGGGAIDQALAQELKNFPNAVWSTYGMTETLSHVAMRRLNGPEASEWYRPLSGVRICRNKEGCLVIDAPQLCGEPLVTNDVVELKSGPLPLFKVLGRKDNVICSGGIKIQAEEVERLLRPHLPMSFLITKTTDSKFGEIVVLVTEGGNTEELALLCHRVLPRYWCPRQVLVVPKILMTETGKPRRDYRLYSL